MEKSTKLQKAFQECQDSAFAKQGYVVTVPLKRLKMNLEMYSGTEEYIKLKDLLNHMTPGFQRNNNKWTPEMKVSFVENVLKGLRTTIQFYHTDKQGEFCSVLDGLQRLTALTEFVNDDFTVFDGLSYYDLLEHGGFMTLTSGTLSFEVFNFYKKDHVEATTDVVNHYVQMNQNITHSPEDIQKSKDWLKKFKEEIK